MYMKITTRAASTALIVTAFAAGLGIGGTGVAIKDKSRAENDEANLALDASPISRLYLLDAGKAEVICQDRLTGQYTRSVDWPMDGPKRKEIRQHLDSGTCRASLKL